jgi:phosphoribosylanthranilate isomerase
MLTTFLSPDTTSLKICGITTAEDARQLATLGVPALGVNFWPQSKRYLSPEDARDVCLPLAGKILRVGVFVNADPSLVRELIKNNIIDVAQFHGDEPPAYCAPFADADIPFIKAVGVNNANSLTHLSDYRATAILLDTPAPGIYGGTGEKFDWTHARDFILTHPETPVLLAGGITPANAGDAIAMVHPAALDVASGAELSPGIKDFTKVKALIHSCAESGNH